MADIAYILKMYPRFSETFIVNEILELERQGLDLRIYALHKPDDGRFHASLARVKAPVVYVPQYPLAEAGRIWAAHRVLLRRDRGRYLRVLGQALSRHNRYALKRFWQAGVIAEHLLRHPVQATHAHFATSAARAAMFVERLIGTPFSFTAHAKDIYHTSVDQDALRAKLRAARFVVTVSEFNRQHLLDLLQGRPADVRRLYNGVDLGTFRPAPSIIRQPDLILSVGRLVEKKGFEQLIQACALLNERGRAFRCEIIGKGPLEGALQAQIDGLGLTRQVKLLGPLPQEDVLTAYQRATVFALPCIVAKDGNRDGLPTVLLEAMAAGLPVISTPVTGVPEIITPDVSGLLVPEADPAALATALDRLLASPALRARLAAAARAKVEADFDVRVNAGTLREWLQPSGLATVAQAARLTVPFTGAPTDLAASPS